MAAAPNRADGATDGGRAQLTSASRRRFFDVRGAQSRCSLRASGGLDLRYCSVFQTFEGVGYDFVSVHVGSSCHWRFEVGKLAHTVESSLSSTLDSR
jgi:hypothetical protein